MVWQRINVIFITYRRTVQENGNRIISPDTMTIHFRRPTDLYGSDISKKLIRRFLQYMNLGIYMKQIKI